MLWIHLWISFLLRQVTQRVLALEHNKDTRLYVWAWAPWPEVQLGKLLSTVMCSSSAQKCSHFERPLAKISPCWHHVSWLGKQSSLQRSEVSRPFVFRTLLGTDGRQNEWEATSKAGYSPLCLSSSLLTPPPQLRHPPETQGARQCGLLYV